MKVYALVVLTNGLFILLMGESEAFVIPIRYSPQNYCSQFEREIVFLTQDNRENKFQTTSSLKTATTIAVETSSASSSTKFEPDDLYIDGSGSGSGPNDGSSLLAPGDSDSEL